MRLGRSGDKWTAKTHRCLHPCLSCISKLTTCIQISLKPRPLPLDVQMLKASNLQRTIFLHLNHVHHCATPFLSQHWHPVPKINTMSLIGDRSGRLHYKWFGVRCIPDHLGGGRLHLWWSDCPRCVLIPRVNSVWEMEHFSFSDRNIFIQTTATL